MIWVSSFHPDLLEDSCIPHEEPEGIRDVVETTVTEAVTDPNLTLLSENITIDVNFRPLWMRLFGGKRPLVAGQSTELVCQGVGARPKPNISWWKESTRLKTVRETMTNTITHHHHEHDDPCSQYVQVRPLDFRLHQYQPSLQMTNLGKDIQNLGPMHMPNVGPNDCHAPYDKVYENWLKYKNSLPLNTSGLAVTDPTIILLSENITIDVNSNLSLDTKSNHIKSPDVNIKQPETSQEFR